jgi:hypothetical protein
MLAIGRWPGVLLVGMSLAAQTYAAPLIDNERVTVRDVSLPEGVSGPATIANTSGYPTAFPRAGAVKVLDDPRFTAWHYSWTKGVPTGMH